MIIIKETISDKQAICIVVLFVWGSTLILGTGGDAKNDMWIAVILAMVLGMLVSIIYARILTSFPDKDIFEINVFLFGKIIGNIINFCLIIYTLNLASLVIDNFTEFINTTGLPDTPRIVPIVFIIVLCIWGVKQGIEVLGRCSVIFAIALTIIIIFTVSMALSRLNPDSLRPIMYNGITPLLRGTLSAFSFPFAETVVFIMLFSSLKKRGSVLKVYWVGIGFAGVLLVIISMRNIMFVGAETLLKNYFPSYTVVSRISIGEFLERIETTVIMSFLFAGFIKVSCCLLAGCIGVSKFFGVEDYRFIVTPISLMVFTFSFIVYSSIIETVKWAPHVYPVYAFSFEVILPIIILIAAELKLWKQRKKNMG